MSTLYPLAALPSSIDIDSRKYKPDRTGDEFVLLYGSGWLLIKNRSKWQHTSINFYIEPYPIEGPVTPLETFTYSVTPNSRILLPLSWPISRPLAINMMYLGPIRKLRICPLIPEEDP